MIQRRENPPLSSMDRRGRVRASIAQLLQELMLVLCALPYLPSGSAITSQRNTHLVDQISTERDKLAPSTLEKLRVVTGSIKATIKGTTLGADPGLTPCGVIPRLMEIKRIGVGTEIEHDSSERRPIAARLGSALAISPSRACLGDTLCAGSPAKGPILSRLGIQSQSNQELEDGVLAPRENPPSQDRIPISARLGNIVRNDNEEGGNPGSNIAGRSKKAPIASRLGPISLSAALSDEPSARAPATEKKRKPGRPPGKRKVPQSPAPSRRKIQAKPPPSRRKTTADGTTPKKVTKAGKSKGGRAQSESLQTNRATSSENLPLNAIDVLSVEAYVSRQVPETRNPRRWNDERLGSMDERCMSKDDFEDAEKTAIYWLFQ
ncbi:hypothetical protein Bca101_041689 [Brassica carinata]